MGIPDLGMVFMYVCVFMVISQFLIYLKKNEFKYLVFDCFCSVFFSTHSVASAVISIFFYGIYSSYRVRGILSYNLYFYSILGVVCLTVFKCLPGIFVDYRILSYNYSYIATQLILYQNVCLKSSYV